MRVRATRWSRGSVMYVVSSALRRYVLLVATSAVRLRVVSLPLLWLLCSHISCVGMDGGRREKATGPAPRADCDPNMDEANKGPGHLLQVVCTPSFTAVPVSL